MAPIAILGAGSLGQLWAGYLPVGQAVFLSRAALLSSSTPKEDGQSVLHYRLKHPDDKETACAVPVASATEICPSLLLVTTKAGDTITALDQTLPGLATNIPVILFQNGLGCQQAVADRWPDRPILAASTTEGANRPQTGMLVHAGRGQTWIGGLNRAGQQDVSEASRQLRASGLDVTAEANIHQRLWDKLVVNAGINAFTAILDCRNGDILTHGFFLEHIDALSDEISQVMATEASCPLPAGEIKDRIFSVATATAENTSSMRSDRLRGRTTEIDVINGYIISRSRAMGIATPVNQMLTRKVKKLTE